MDAAERNEAERLVWWTEACEEADYRWHLFIHATTPLDQAEALTALSTAMFAVRTYLPGYDYNTSTLPWEREDEDLTSGQDSAKVQP